MSTDRLTAGKTTDRLVDNGLKDRSGEIFTGCAFVDQGLDICLGKYTASGSNRVDCFIIFGKFIQAGCIRLDEGRHLVDERTGTAGTDSVHTLLNVTAFEVDDLGIFAAELDRNICLWCIMLQSSRYRDYLLYKRNSKMFGKGQSAGTGDHWRNR